MPASNKIIFSLTQNLDIDEKNRARHNIGAVGLFNRTAQTVTHTVTNNEAQAGHITLPLSLVKPGVYLVNLELYAASDAGLGNTRIPLHIRFDYTYEGGAHSSSFVHTGTLEQLENNGSWHYGDSISLRTNYSDLTGVSLEIYFAAWAIQANKNVQISVDSVLLSETDPT